MRGQPAGVSFIAVSIRARSVYRPMILRIFHGNVNYCFDARVSWRPPRSSRQDPFTKSACASSGCRTDDPLHAPKGPARRRIEVARERRFGYLLVESTGLPEPVRVAEPRLGRRTVLTFPLLPPPQKN